jgi:hypothetical protein
MHLVSMSTLLILLSIGSRYHHPLGLGYHNDHLKAVIKRIVPIPTFHTVRNELLLEELTMETKAPTPVLALYSAPHGSQAPLWGQEPRHSSTGAPTHPPAFIPTSIVWHHHR